MSNKRFSSSSNPMMGQFKKMQHGQTIALEHQGEAMTIDGTINKTMLMLLLVAVVTGWSFFNPSSTLMYVGMFGGLGIAIFLSFKPHLAPILAPIYAILEGLFLGAVTYSFAASFDGIIYYAVGLTIFTFASMLLLYRMNIIPITEKFRMGVAAATGGIFLMYLFAFISSHFFGVDPIYLHDGSLLAIGLSIVIIGVAALNLLLDFDMIDKGVQSNAPKYMEWFGAFALTVTLVWLYFEFLRLLSMLQSD